MDSFWSLFRTCTQPNKLQTLSQIRLREGKMGNVSRLYGSSGIASSKVRPYRGQKDWYSAPNPPKVSLRRLSMLQKLADRTLHWRNLVYFQRSELNHGTINRHSFNSGGAQHCYAKQNSIPSHPQNQNVRTPRREKAGIRWCCPPEEATDQVQNTSDTHKKAANTSSTDQQLDG